MAPNNRLWRSFAKEMAEYGRFSKLARPLQYRLHRQDGPAGKLQKGNFMYQVSSVSNRIAAGAAAFFLTMFTIAASFAPQGAFVAGFVA